MFRFCIPKFDLFLLRCSNLFSLRSFRSLFFFDIRKSAYLDFGSFTRMRGHTELDFKETKFIWAETKLSMSVVWLPIAKRVGGSEAE